MLGSPAPCQPLDITAKILIRQSAGGVWFVVFRLCGGVSVVFNVVFSLCLCHRNVIEQ